MLLITFQVICDNYLHENKSLFYIYPILNRYLLIFLENTDKTNRAVEDNKENTNVEIHSQRVKAGKRTYFFDVKSTRSNDYYITITESKKKYKDDGVFYEKHKLFLYKEDFNKFLEALQGSVDHVKNVLMPDVDFDQLERTEEDRDSGSASDSRLKWD